MIDPIVRASLDVLPFAQSIVGGDRRDVAFLCIDDEFAIGAAKKIGFGECAPLAGLHRETLDDAMTALEDFLDGIRDIDDLPPSAAFAASCALATSAGFGSTPVPDAKVAAFFAGGAAELLDGEIARLSSASAVKLKIGRASEADDRALLERALAALPRARFRLDGNRKLTRSACESLVRGLDAARFEYLEDPLVDPSELAALAKSTGIAIALDETVVDRTAAAAELRAQLARDKAVAVWVLRMSAIGSLDAIYDAARDAALHGADVVLSTAYESSYTLRLAVHVAAAIPNARRAHGLGTAHVLANDVCASAVVRDGVIAGDALPVPLAEAWE